MYQIFYEDSIIGSLAVEELSYYDAILTQQINTADSFVFTLSAQNPYLNSLYIRNGLIKLICNGETLFVGDIVNITANFDNSIKVDCQGCLAWLKDVAIVHYVKTSSAREYLEDLLVHYNAAAPFRAINYGLSDMLTNVSHDHSESIRSISYLLNEVVEECGGYLLPRYNSKGIYLDYLLTTAESTQRIEFGRNLMDLTRELDGKEIVTRIYPYGHNGLVMSSPYYVRDAELEGLYGIIAEAKQYDVGTDGELQAAAQADLDNRRAVINSITLKAFDQSLIDNNVEPLKLGDISQVISRPHNIDLQMMVIAKETYLNNPKASSITLGKKTTAITEKIRQLDKK